MACHATVPLRPFWLRSILTLLSKNFKQGRDNLSKKISLQELWADLSQVKQGLYQPSQTLTTDASELVWGAFLGPHCHASLWCQEESLLQVNLLETFVVFRALHVLEPVFQRAVILLQTDNTTVMSYINRTGGTIFPSLDSLARQIILWYLDGGVSLRAVHVYLSGADNVDADLLSRQLSI